MSFESYIPKLISDFAEAWNNQEMDAFADMITDDIKVSTPGLIFTNASIKPQVIYGRKDTMNFLTKTRKKLPLRLLVTDVAIGANKHVSFKVHYYEIDVWSRYECVISTYGKFEDLKITRLEDTEGTKISTIYILKNVLKHQLKNIFKK